MIYFGTHGFMFRHLSSWSFIATPEIPKSFCAPFDDFILLFFAELWPGAN